MVTFYIHIYDQKGNIFISVCRKCNKYIRFLNRQRKNILWSKHIMFNWNIDIIFVWFVSDTFIHLRIYHQLRLGYKRNRNLQALTRNLPGIMLPVSVPVFFRLLACVSVTGFNNFEYYWSTKKRRPCSCFIPITGRIKTGISGLEPEVSGYPKVRSFML